MGEAMTTAKTSPDVKDSRLTLEGDEAELWQGYGENRRISMSQAERAAVLATTDPALDGLRAKLRDYEAATAQERDIYILATRLVREGELEFDGDAVISMGSDNGAYVSGWSWVDFTGTPYDIESDHIHFEIVDFVLTRLCAASRDQDAEATRRQLEVPALMTQATFLEVQKLCEAMELDVAKGQEDPGAIGLDDLDELLDAQPWTMHPDHGCVLKSDVNDLDRVAASRPRERS